MSIRNYLGYWTIFVDDKPVMSFDSFRSALEALEQSTPWGLL